MRVTDLDAVMAIETEAFFTPWSRDSFLNDIGRVDAVTLVGCTDGVPAGYIVAWLVTDEIHVGNLAVHSDYRRQGLAQALIQTMLRMVRGTTRVWLEVRQSNHPAIQLYHKVGFKDVSIRRKYYQAENEDAIVMSREFKVDQAEIDSP